MNSKIFYKITAGVYDLLDKIYFADYDRSPRRAVILSINNNDNVLDICTGTATNAINIAKKKPTVKVIGIDLSRDMLKIAKKKVKKEKISNVKLRYMDATELTFKTGKFDKVLISLVLHELDEPVANQIMEQAKRVLKNDGEIIVTEWESSKQMWRRILFLPNHLLEAKSYRSFIKKDLYSYFGKMGLVITEVKHCNYSKVLKLHKV